MPPDCGKGESGRWGGPKAHSGPLILLALSPCITPPAPQQSRGCGVCRGCQTREDCGRCRVCLRPPRPGLRRQWKCIQRRCLRVSQAEGASSGIARAGAEVILLSKLLWLLVPPNLTLPSSCLLFSPTPCSPSWPTYLPLSASTLPTGFVATISDVNDTLPYLWLPPL